MKGSFKTAMIDLVRILLPVVIIVLGISGFLVLGQRQPPPPRDTGGDKAPLVKTVAVQPHTQGLAIQVNGVVVPYREITMAAEVTGRILYKNPDSRSGRFVTKGTELVRIDPADFELEVNQLEAELKQGQRNQEENVQEIVNTQKLAKLAEDQLALQKKSLQRVVKTGIASSQQDLDEAQKAVLTAENSLQTLLNLEKLLDVRQNKLKAAIDVIAAKKARAELDLQRTKIVAPVDGVIIDCPVEEDSHIQAGKTVIVIEDTSAVEVKCNLLMSDLAWVLQQAPVKSEQLNGDPLALSDYELPHTPVEVQYQFGHQVLVWKGHLARYEGPGLDEKTRTVPVRVVVDEPRSFSLKSTAGAPATPAASGQEKLIKINGPKALMRGMFVTVRVLITPQVPLVSVPEEALKPGNVVWCVRDGKLAAVPVQIVQTAKGRIIVQASEHLSAVDRVIITPLAHAVNGIIVREEKAR
jgi:multidrug efflux pump subunit AcrA (membrane-fusion protein)